MTTLYITNGWQKIEQMIQYDLPIVLTYATRVSEKDPQPEFYAFDGYTIAWAKSLEDLQEICESHANGREVTLVKSN